MPNKSLTILLFGATGDLFQKKILPAFEALSRNGILPQNTEFVAYGRRVFDDRAFQQFLALHFRNSGFLSKFSYVSGELADEEGYERLKERIREKSGTKGALLTYLSLPPEEIPKVVQKLQDSGILSRGANSKRSYSRILIEKPFGSDLESAKKLNAALLKSFAEKNIFRIDHYLHKRILRGITLFRTANPAFEAVWNGKHIAKISASILETGDVSTRASFYDTVGAFLDVGQNHLLQMLGAAILDLPKGSSPSVMQNTRGNAFKKLMPGVKRKEYIRAEYEGYLEERGVVPTSKTETYFSIPVSCKGSRWKGIDFRLTSGKALSENRAMVEVEFKNGAALTFRIQPNPDINFKYPTVRDEKRTFPVDFEKPRMEFPTEAYESLFAAALKGDQGQFVGKDEAIAAWKFAEAVKRQLKKVPVSTYRKGTLPKANLAETQRVFPKNPRSRE